MEYKSNARIFKLIIDYSLISKIKGKKLKMLKYEYKLRLVVCKNETSM